MYAWYLKSDKRTITDITVGAVNNRNLPDELESNLETNIYLYIDMENY